MIYSVLEAADICPAPAKYGSRAQLVSYARTPSGSLAEQDGRWGVLILPGGGYRILADSESEPVALSFLAQGCQAFLLRYTLTPARYPTQLLEAAAATAFLRAHKNEYGITHIAVCGLSAGGHLAGCLANLWGLPLLSGALRMPSEHFRPDAAILSYPVISASAPKLSPIFERLTGTVPPLAGEFSALSLETSVTPRNPPAFLWATVNDPQVPVEHTMLYADALRKAGVPFELHLFQNGPHAMSVATAESARAPQYVSSHVASWVPLCAQWLHHEALSSPVSARWTANE